MAIATIGLDLVKPEFPLVGYDERFKEVKRRTLRRDQVLDFFDRLQPCRIGMELCTGAHFWGRQFKEFGHEVKLIPTHYVKSELRDSNKGFFNDARIIADAASKPEIPSVHIRTEGQQELHAIHRMHSQCLQERTALCNLTWRLLGDFGVCLPKGVKALRRHLPELLQDQDNSLSEVFRRMLSRRYEQLLELDEHLIFFENELDLVKRQGRPIRLARRQSRS